MNNGEHQEASTAQQVEQEKSVDSQDNLTPPTQVQQLQAEVNRWKEQYLRAVAEMENARKRIASRYATQSQQEKQRILLDMLTLADNLERALQHVHLSTNDTGLRAGVELTLTDLLNILKKYNVHPIEALGKSFDPTLHEAVGEVHTADHRPGTVMKVEQRGYMHGDELLRPARVIVAAEG